MSDKPKFTVGQRVTGIAWGHNGKGGSVTKTGRGASLLVRWDGGSEDERVNDGHIRPETPDDVAEREVRRAVQQWQIDRPKVSIASLQSAGYSNHLTGQVICGPRTPDEMRQAAKELEALADWFERRPKEKQ